MVISKLHFYLIKNTKILFILLIIISACNLLAQNQDKSISKSSKKKFGKAFEYFKQQKLDNASEILLEILEKDDSYIDATLLLSQIYLKQGQIEKEKELYLNYLSKNANLDVVWYNLADVYVRENNFKKAIETFSVLDTLKGVQPRVKTLAIERKNKIYTLDSIQSNSVDVKITTLPNSINSEYHEYPPSFTVDGEWMYFTRLLENKNETNNFFRYNEDIYIAQKQGMIFSEPTPVNHINTRDNEASIAIAPDGSFMVFTRCKTNQNNSGCDLYISFFIDGKWTKAVNMGEPVNTRYKETQPSISYDGKTIYFASDRPGGIGGLDIYSSTRDEQWNFSTPINLGDKVNSLKDEQCPYIHIDNETLYFSSNGWVGFGGQDIFYSKYVANKGEWKEAKNLGYPINTQSNEIGLTVDRLGKYAYYSGGGLSKDNNLDIHYFELPEYAKPQKTSYLKVFVHDKFTGEPLSANYELRDPINGAIVSNGVANNEGQFLFVLKPEKEYMLNVKHKGYLFFSEYINVKIQSIETPFIYNVDLSPISVGEKLILHNILFKTKSYEIQESSYPELDLVVNLLKENPTLKVEISGHTDNTGTALKNMELSFYRAWAVYKYLTKIGGIEENRLTYKGFGDTTPIASNATDFGKSQNRRTEIKIVE